MGGAPRQSNCGSYNMRETYDSKYNWRIYATHVTKRTLFKIVHVIAKRKGGLLLNMEFFFRPHCRAAPNQVFRPLLRFFCQVVTLLRGRRLASCAFRAVPPAPTEAQRAKPTPPTRTLQPTGKTRRTTRFPNHSTTIRPSQRHHHPTKRPIQRESKCESY